MHVSHWRNIGDYPIEDHPLVLCDASSLPEKNCRVVTLYPRVSRKETVFPTSALYAVYGEGYKWYYMSRMTRDQVWLFKQDDNAVVQRPRGYSMGAFVMKTSPATPHPGRVGSVELWCSLFHRTTGTNSLLSRRTTGRCYNRGTWKGTPE